MMASNGPPLLVLDKLHKRYKHGLIRSRTTFSLAADMSFATPEIIGMLGPNGAGKTTLFEMMTGSNVPTSGRVLCLGQDIHRVKYRQRDRLAIHYHQSYQVRKMRRRTPSFLLDAAKSDYPFVHLFDEPQFNTQDGYIGFMLDFFRRLRRQGKLVFLCLHPNEPWHLEILRETCERFIFVDRGRLMDAQDFASLASNPAVTAYLGRLAPVDG